MAEKQCIWFNSALFFFFIALLESCFSTSAFRNMYFLLDLCSARKNTHFPLFSFFFLPTFSRFLHDELAHRTVCAALFFRLFRRHVSTNSFKCFYSPPFSIYERKQKAIYIYSYLWGPEGTRELPPIPEVRESWRAGLYFRDAMTRHSPAAPLQHTLDFRRVTGDDTGQDPALGLIKPPSWKPSKNVSTGLVPPHGETQSSCCCIRSPVAARSNPPLYFFPLITCKKPQKTQNKTVGLQRGPQRSAAAGTVQAFLLISVQGTGREDGWEGLSLWAQS